ncbi:MAG: UMP kinase [Patescibacteria group bacterium]|jgi:uridylate kinase
MTDHPKYKRVLLKLSGEALGGADGRIIDPLWLERFAREVGEAKKLGIEIAIVIGGWNIFRGKMAEELHIPKETGDHMGMLATVMNALALQSALENLDVKTRVLSAIQMDRIAEPYIQRRAIRHLEKGRVVIFAAGSGNPHFTTDTAAILRGAEIKADIVMKATNVDGVFHKDPRQHDDARRYHRLSFDEAIVQKLGAMDPTAMTLSRDRDLPILVFSLKEPGSITRALRGDDVGTYVSQDPEIVYHS